MEERIGQYRIERKLGSGGVGEVFLAEDEVLRRPVALKRLRPELASREAVVARFRSEAQTLARLNHPNIATLYSFERYGDAHVMVMEYVEGQTASASLRRSGPMQLRPALALFTQALAGIGYAHEHGVVHRDIKGANLIVTPKGVVKVMDFGIARVLGEERLTRVGQLVGTPEMMSPEQIRGDEVDARSDLYSLGALLYSLLAGRPPFVEGSEYDVLKAQVELVPASLISLGVEVPLEVEEVILAALAKDPSERPASAAEFREALAPFAPEVDACPSELAGSRQRSIGGGLPNPTPEATETRVELDDEPADTDVPTTGIDTPSPSPLPAPRTGERGASRRVGAWAATTAVLITLGVIRNEPKPIPEPPPATRAPATADRRPELWAAPGTETSDWTPPMELEAAQTAPEPQSAARPEPQETVHSTAGSAEEKVLNAVAPVPPADSTRNRGQSAVRPQTSGGNESTDGTKGWVIRRR